MRTNINPERQDIEPGREVIFVLSVTNTSTVISGHRIRVLGLDPSWVSIEDPTLSLFPDATGTTRIHVTPPQGLPSGSRQFIVEVESLTPPIETDQVAAELVIPARQAMRISLDPPSSTAGKEARVGVVVKNEGTASVDATLEGHDDPAQVIFAFEPETINLEPGEQFLATGRLRAKRPWFGSPKIRSFSIKATAHDQSVAAQGSWVQSPRVSRGVLALVGLVVVGTIFAAVIAGSLSQVVDRSNANSQLALQVAQAAQNKVATGTGSITGFVRLATNQAPVAGVTVDLYQPSNLTSPAASTATQTNGSYQFAALAPGSYDLSFTGAGFAQLWYPDAVTASAAKPISLSNGAHLRGIDISIGALPVSIAGSVTGLSPTGAELALQLPSATPLASVAASPSSGASAIPNGVVVAKTTLNASGTFDFHNIPSPETYQLVLTKSGDASVVQTVTVASGQSQSGIDLVLTPGNGLISGTVQGPSGPIGGASIIATVGTSTSSTVSLTNAPNIGDFTVQDLATPANVSLQVSAPGFATQTLSVTLAPNQHATGIVVDLEPGVGSITGVVTTPSGTPAGGVNVTATFGSKTQTTVTASTGTVGAYQLANLVVPGTYTITFSRSDLLSQTVVVQLTGATPTASGINVSMIASTASMSGVVSQTGGQGIGNATVELVSGTATYSVQTAADPVAGSYVITGITPGTYTLNFTRTGGLPVSTIITLTAGENLTRNQQLSPAAGITAQVVNASSGQPIPGATVNLYFTASYSPGSPALSTATTNANGDFTFPNLEAPQSYLVTIAYPAGSTPEASYNVTTQEGVTVCATNGSTTTSGCEIQLTVAG